MIVEGIVGVLGVAGITMLLVYIFYSVFRLKMIYLASDLSKEIQGVASLPKPTLRSMVALVKWLVSRRNEIVEPKKDDEDDEKYRHTYG